MDQYAFRYCQKIVVLSKDLGSILLAKRQQEIEYDGVFSFIGGKMEASEDSILASLQREKNEEVSQDFRIRLLLTFSTNVFSRNKDGTPMILPHYLAIHQDGEVELSSEYSQYRWIPIDELETFELKIANIPTVTRQLLRLMQVAKTGDWVLL